MALAGGSRFIFQWEAMRTGDGSGDDESQLERAIQLATLVVESGMTCGVSINPETEVDTIYSLVKTGLVDLVDVLAVEPGFGGQSFQPKALQKVETLKQWRDQNGASFDIMVDGGINGQTAPAAWLAGADILVVGTFLFGHGKSMSHGVEELLLAAAKGSLLK